MYTFRLPILPMLVGLVLLLAGYHFNNAIELQIAGVLFMAWGTCTHFKNIRIIRRWHGDRPYNRDCFL
ncbi:MAG: hypothetical protein Unbinned4120contig1000_31 [Prokaryotic dsDNA virus sp.]|jgi:hypothetical protein|nr:MAG: hypothetical protein Unbinned4120contig1000_31 [Prokaryotic dsDNA virus sp.]